MLEQVADLNLTRLNEATLAWAEGEYNRKVNSETGQTPIARFLAGPSVMRPCPDSAALRLAFTRTERRRQRKSDGTLVLESRRFEVPDRYRHVSELEVRYASWDLSHVHLVDERSGTVLCRLFPQNVPLPTCPTACQEGKWEAGFRAPERSCDEVASPLPHILLFGPVEHIPSPRPLISSAGARSECR